MWMLVKRTSLCDFLPTIGSDYLYFYAPRQPKQESFWKLLERPFLPFERWLWGAIGGFLIFTTVLFVLSQLGSAGQPENLAVHTAYSCFLSISGFLGGEGHEAPEICSKIVSLVHVYTFAHT